MNIKDQKIKNTFTERSYRFSIAIIKLTEIFPQKRAYWVITDQLIRSATSIGANIVEAKSASSKRDYINFYNHALKSANETIYWLTLLEELKTVNVNTLLIEARELANILGASIITMKNNSRPNL